MMQRVHGKQGQAMVEYIIIVVVIAIAALVVFGLFGDTIKTKMSGAISEMDETGLDTDAQDAADESSLEQLKQLDAEGAN
jgi:Flp pilus assembly pilin Flp